MVQGKPFSKFNFNFVTQKNSDLMFKFYLFYNSSLEASGSLFLFGLNNKQKTHHRAHHTWHQQPKAFHCLITKQIQHGNNTKDSFIETEDACCGHFEEEKHRFDLSKTLAGRSLYLTLDRENKLNSWIYCLSPSAGAIEVISCDQSIVGLIFRTFFICCSGCSINIDAQNTDAEVLSAKHHQRKAQGWREKIR